jgi:hypothetical protein
MIWLGPLVALLFLILTVIGLRYGLIGYMGAFGWGALLGSAFTYWYTR